ncbi:MAG TPA: VOC family protein [Pyrinomonadaceae bacterium]|nr:VOC family protein [Pyrinomonadaceae bacterium]
MKLNPYLIFNGQCDAAFKFYEQLLDAKITFKMTFGESPAADQVPPESRDLIIHATLALGDQLLMASDSPPDKYARPAGVYVSLNLSDPAKGKRIFESLAEGGTVQMPFEKTFWAAGFGMCIDRFGIPWMVNCEQAA